MADETGDSMANLAASSEKKTPSKASSQEIFEWAGSFHHDTPPMFRRKVDDTGTLSIPVDEQKLVNYESDSLDESPSKKPSSPTAASSSISRPLPLRSQKSSLRDIDHPTSPTISPLTPPPHVVSSAAKPRGIDRLTSVVSDPGPDRDSRTLASIVPASRDEEQPTEKALTNDYQLNFAGPAYPTIQQPSVPDLSNVNDPNGMSARRLTKYQSFDAGDSFLQTHLHPVNEHHFGPRFHTKFFVKTIGTIMCDQCKQKNQGEMYKCHTCTNQICRVCVEDRLRREEDERNNPPTHGEDPYEWEWNGKDRHEGFKVCYLKRKEKSNGQGDYSIPFIGIANGENAVAGKIEMIMSDVQGGRKRKEPPESIHQDRVKLQATESENGQQCAVNRASSKESERVQQMVFGKDSTTLAKLTRIKEAAQTAAVGGSVVSRKPPQFETEPDSRAGYQARARARARARDREKMQKQQQQQQNSHYHVMSRPQMPPGGGPSYDTPSPRQTPVPTTAPESPYAGGSFEEAQRRGYVGPMWDGRGLPPYQYHPFQPFNRQYETFHHQAIGQEQSHGNQHIAQAGRPVPGMPFIPDGRPYFYDPPPSQWGAYGHPYPMSEAEHFQAHMHHQQQLQAQQAAMNHMAFYGMPMHAAGAGDRNRGHLPGLFRSSTHNEMEGSVEQARARAAGSMPTNALPREAARPSEPRPQPEYVDTPNGRFTQEEILKNPSLQLPDDPTIFIPHHHRASPEVDETKWKALLEAAETLHEADFGHVDGMTVGDFSAEQLATLQIAAKEGQRQNREQVAKEAMEKEAAGDTVVIEDDEDEVEEDDDDDRRTQAMDDDAETEIIETSPPGMPGVRKRNMTVVTYDSGRLRSGKEFTS